MSRGGADHCGGVGQAGVFSRWSIRRWSISAGWLLLLPSAVAFGQESSTDSGLELTSPVRQQLRFLTESWRGWTRAYYQSEEDVAAGALQQLLATAGQLGMTSLPDLSNAASAFAMTAAREGDFDRARWTLEAARQLDPDRPETDFATAAVKRLEGDYLSVIIHSLKGHARLLRLPLERSIWLHNLGLWLIYTLILSSGLFVALQMATKGGALLYDLARFMSPPLPLPTADILTIIALLWPLLLPSGLLWLAIYWSILLWGYGSWSEKVVFVVLWLCLGVVPLLLSLQQRAVQLTLAPPVRAVDNLVAGRLYGAFFSDLGVLRTLMPDHPVTQELTADLHRRFGQWEHARSIYTALIESGDLQGREAASAHNNLGVYHHRNKDFGTAVNYFRQATAADPSLPESFFNLAQAYSQLYKFSDSNLAMARAKEIDRGRVNRWERAEVSVEDSAVGVDGGILRAGRVRGELRAIWYREEDSLSAVALWRRYFSLSVVAGIMLLAVTLHLVRNQLGYRSNLLENSALLPAAADRWLQALVPGLRSVRAERGARAFLSLLLPVALVTVVAVRGLGYRAPLAFDSGTELPTFLGYGGLTLWLALRLVRELRR